MLLFSPSFPAALHPRSSLTPISLFPSYSSPASSSNPTLLAMSTLTSRTTATTAAPTTASTVQQSAALGRNAGSLLRNYLPQIMSIARLAFTNILAFIGALRNALLGGAVGAGGATARPAVVDHRL